MGMTTPVSFTGNGGHDRFDASTATNAVTLDGGAGDDTLIGGLAESLQPAMIERIVVKSAD